MPDSSYFQWPSSQADEPASQSQGSTVLSSAPSCLQIPSRWGSSGNVHDVEMDFEEGLSNDSEKDDVPVIFVGSKKARKSWVWNSVNGEEYWEPKHGKWRWRCVRCEFSYFLFTT